jgi:hypothetical protein
MARWSLFLYASLLLLRQLYVNNWKVHLPIDHTHLRTSSKMTHLGLYTRRAFILVFYPHFSHPQRPSNPSPPSHNDSLLASLTPVIPPLFAWQRAFGDLSFEITSPRLGSPVPPGLLTETRSCVPPSSLFHPTYSSYSTCNALLVFFTSPLLFSFTFYFLLHTSQRGDVVLRLPELAYVA